MNRIVKFKLWNIPQQIFFDEGFSIAMDGTAWYDDNGHEHQLIEGRFILCQFTGLLDNNSKEIYEGFILDNPTDGRIEVRYNLEYGCWEAIWIDDFEDQITGDISKKEFSELLANILKDGNDTYEIIGNIYENPELLTP